MNKYHVDVFFPTLPSGIARQQTVVEAAKVHTAINRALTEIKQRKGMKGRRIGTVQITATKVGSHGPQGS